ncbi:uncharacterized protein [Tiliqua scincoides]|uniref:uncharacterized protein n=1 Tax=Tiliqua scincoides TaxID=71010 RepID=UPI0034636AED
MARGAPARPLSPAPSPATGNYATARPPAFRQGSPPLREGAEAGSAPAAPLPSRRRAGGQPVPVYSEVSPMLANGAYSQEEEGCCYLDPLSAHLNNWEGDQRGDWSTKDNLKWIGPGQRNTLKTGISLLAITSFHHVRVHSKGIFAMESQDIRNGIMATIDWQILLTKERCCECQDIHSDKSFTPTWFIFTKFPIQEDAYTETCGDCGSRLTLQPCLLHLE